MKNISISDFISNKKIKKIRDVIDSSSNNEDSYDEIADILDDDFTIKDLGTNRIIFVSKDKDNDKLIFKVAGDKHGIEANYREFYNSHDDHIDKRFTKSYAISKGGEVLIAERVKPFSSKDMDERKSDVVDMLKHLSHKILLVDCKLSNFKNFGIRKNGDVCLLDHGDTVPLPNYQSDDIVNIDEESFVSLRCKNYKKDKKTGKIKKCNGKLKYNKDFSEFICSECNEEYPIHDAYRQYYGDITKALPSDVSVDLSPSFIAWRNNLYDTIVDYCVNSSSDEEDENREEKNDMKMKIIDGETCYQVCGYWIPESLTTGSYSMSYMSVKTGKMKVSDLFKSAGIDPDPYKVTFDDHRDQAPARRTYSIEDIAENIYDAALKYHRRNGIKEPFIKLTNYNVKEEWINDVARLILDKHRDISRIEIDRNSFDKFIISFDDNVDTDDDDIVESISLEVNSGEVLKKDDEKKVEFTHAGIQSIAGVDIDEIGDDEEEEDDEELADEEKAELIDSAVQEITGVNNEEEENEVTTNESEIVINNATCLIGCGYYVPKTIFVPNLTHDETKKLLKDNGYSPKVFKIDKKSKSRDDNGFTDRENYIYEATRNRFMSELCSEVIVNNDIYDEVVGSANSLIETIGNISDALRFLNLKFPDEFDADLNRFIVAIDMLKGIKANKE